MTSATENPRQRIAIANALTITLLLLKVVASIFTIPLCIRYLGQQDTNLWLLLLTVSNYLSLLELGLSQLAMNASGTAHALGNRDEVSRVLSTSVLLLASLAGILIGVSSAVISIFPVGDWLTAGSPENANLLQRCLLIMVPFSLARVPASATAGVLSGLRDHHLRIGLEVFQVIAYLIAFWLCLAGGGDLTLLVWITSIVMLVFSAGPLVALLTRHRAVRLGLGYWSGSLSRSLLRQAWLYAPLPLCLLIQRVLPVTITSRFIGLTHVTEIYLLSMLFRNFLTSLLDSISKSVQPYIIMLDAQGDHDRVRVHWSRSTRIVAALSLLALPAVVLLYNAFAALVAQSTASASPLAIVSFGLLFFIEASLTPGVNYSIALGRFSELTVTWISSAILSVVLGIAGAIAFESDPAGGLGAGILAAHLLVYFPGQVRSSSRILGTRPWKLLRESFGQLLLAPPVISAATFLLLMLPGDGGGLPAWRHVSWAVSIMAAVGAFLVVQLDVEEKAWITLQIRLLFRGAPDSRA